MSKPNDIVSHDDKGRLHGEHILYWGDGRLSFKGDYFHGKQRGLWLENGLFGDWNYKIYYI